MKLEEQQAENLRNNWSTRKDLSTKITNIAGYDLYRWNSGDGRIVFYILRDVIPVGYIAGHKLENGMQISSTFMIPLLRRKGLTTVMYGAIIRLMGKLISDCELSDGAKALWNKLQRDPTFIITFNSDESRFTAIMKRK